MTKEIIQEGIPIIYQWIQKNQNESIEELKRICNEIQQEKD